MVFPDEDGRSRITYDGAVDRFQAACEGLNPSRVDAKRGDHFLQADFTGLIPPSKPDSFRLADNPRSDLIEAL